MTALVTTRVKMDGANEAHPADPPNATLQITLSSVPAFSTARPPQPAALPERRRQRDEEPDDQQRQRDPGGDAALGQELSLPREVTLYARAGVLGRREPEQAGREDQQGY